MLKPQQARCCKHGRRWTTATVSQVMTHRWWRCWLRQKTTKCLWQEASTLRQRQQNSAFNCTQWQICSLCKDSTLRFVLLKLTTDRHEASRGLFATAELLVCYKEASNDISYGLFSQPSPRLLSVGLLYTTYYSLFCANNAAKLLPCLLNICTVSYYP